MLPHSPSLFTLFSSLLSVFAVCLCVFCNGGTNLNNKTTPCLRQVISKRSRTTSTAVRLLRSLAWKDFLGPTYIYRDWIPWLIGYEHRLATSEPHATSAPPPRRYYFFLRHAASSRFTPMTRSSATRRNRHQRQRQRHQLHPATSHRHTNNNVDSQIGVIPLCILVHHALLQQGSELLQRF